MESVACARETMTLIQRKFDEGDTLEAILLLGGLSGDIGTIERRAAGVEQIVQSD